MPTVQTKPTEKLLQAKLLLEWSLGRSLNINSLSMLYHQVGQWPSGNMRERQITRSVVRFPAVTGFFLGNLALENVNVGGRGGRGATEAFKAGYKNWRVALLIFFPHIIHLYIGQGLHLPSFRFFPNIYGTKDWRP